MGDQSIKIPYDHQRLNHPRHIPWIMKQTWLDTLFVHFPVEKEFLNKVVPSSLPVDTFNQTGWISFVPYIVSSVRIRGLPPIPGIRQFVGFNIRTYVNLNGKPGVYFFSLAATDWLNAKMAKLFFQLPYFYRNMDIVVKTADSFTFSLREQERQTEWTYRPTSDQRLAVKGSLEEWLVERYCLYTVNKRGEPMRSDIRHRSWLLQDVEVDFQDSSIFSDHWISLSSQKPICHYSKKKEVQIWPIRLC